MARVLLPEVMTRFKCNEKGCCCKGWRIYFPPEDVGTMLLALPAGERDAVLEGAEVVLDDDDSIQRLRLRLEGPDLHCQFLAGDGRCGFHVKYGPEALPHLCRTFPAFSHNRPGGLELHYDAMCPEVLERLDESDAPLEFLYTDAPEGSELEQRARRAMTLPPLLIGGRTVEEAEFAHLRGEILEALGTLDAPPLHVLAAVHAALARLAEGEAPGSFRVVVGDPSEFLAYFDTCLSIHQDHFLARLMMDYRRFVWVVELPPFDTASLAPHLRAPARWRDHLDLDAPPLAPLVRRWLAHHFFSPFDHSPAANHLGFSWGSITHTLACALRYAVGLSRLLGRPADRTLLKVGMGAAEYVFRTARVPLTSMPWWGVG